MFNPETFVVHQAGVRYAVLDEGSSNEGRSFVSAHFSKDEAIDACGPNQNVYPVYGDVVDTAFPAVIVLADFAFDPEEYVPAEEAA